MKRVVPFVLAPLALVAACSSSDPAREPEERKPANAPPEAKALASGLEPGNADANVRPQDDLFRATNGGWLARTGIPDDRSSWGSFAALGDKTEGDLKAIVESAAKDCAAGTATGEVQKVGDLYRSFLDEKRVEERGLAPIADDLAAIEKVSSKAELVKLLARFLRDGLAVAFHTGVTTDPKNSSRYVLELGQGGTTLPDRDYYLAKKYEPKLAAYGPHVARVLELAGTKDAAAVASSIVALETSLARVQWTKEESRDDTKTYNRKTRADLATLAPGIDWDAFLDGIGASAAREVVVSQPSFFAGLAKLLDEVPLATWKSWLRWRTIHHSGELLPSAVADAEFSFWSTKLKGIPAQRPRWKRAISTVQWNLGMALGKLYVAKHYPPEAHARMEKLVANVIAAFKERIEGLDWMSAATKEKALAKLAAFTPKIGHPKKWRDYSTVEIKADDLVGNVRRAAAFEWNRRVTRLDQPVDRDEWFMPPHVVNAYYSSGMNEIVFPAAILQPPFFDLNADDAVNYGGIGAVIGHEIGHGFDDQGSKWDGAGNLVDWWTPADRAEFEKRGAKLAAQYDKFEPFPGFNVNGRLTLGENIGDLAGATVSHAAYRRSLEGKPAPVIDGLTGDQRFFMGFAQIWRAKTREDEAKSRLATDPHSPPECRANGTVRNVAAFYEAFGVKEGDRMFLPPEDRVRIW